MSPLELPRKSKYELEITDDSQEDTERAIAHFIENVRSDDLRLKELLVDRYAQDIYRFCQAILEKNWRYPAKQSDVISNTKEVFSIAFSDLTDFTGKSSARDWLFEIAIKVCGRQRIYKLSFRYLLRRNRDYVAEISIDGELAKQNRIWDAMDRVASKTRTLLILQNLFHITPPELAEITGMQPRQVQDALDEGLAQIISNPSLSTQELEEEYQSAFQDRWPAPNLEKSELEDQLTAELAQIQKKRLSFQKFPIYAREIALLIALTLFTLIGIATLRRMDDSLAKAPFPPTLAPPPTPIQISQTNLITLEDPAIVEGFQTTMMFFSNEPSLSRDGRILAFTSSIDTLVPDDYNHALDIFVFDRETKEIKRASIASDGTQANQSSLFPSVSADGRWIAFSSLASNLVPNDQQSCLLGDFVLNCSDIFLHDLEKGTTECISQSYDGKEANGYSYQPTITPDGRWIAYWSDATNLTPEINGSCQSNDLDTRCFDIYIYDRLNGVTERVPIGRDLALFRIEPISLSENGRYLALTIFANDQVAQEIQLEADTDTFIYDRQTQSYQPINLSNNGLTGNQPAINPQISQDGRYALFISKSDNLSPKDHNQKEDVYLRDLRSGTTQLISATREGNSGNAESGTTMIPDLLGWGYQASISADGSAIAYISQADDLDPNRSNFCQNQEKKYCRSIYLYDTDSGSELHLQGLNNDRFYLNVRLSGDGRWIAAVEQYFRCPYIDLCAELWLYDRQTKSLINPIRESWRKQFGGRYRWSDITYEQGSKVNAITYSPNRGLIASGGNDGVIRLWNIADGSSGGTLIGHSLPITGLEFMDDGSHLVSASNDGRVYLWQLDKRKPDTLIRQSSPVLSLALSQDGRYLAAGGSGVAWLLVEEGDGFVLYETLVFPAQFINSLSFAPGGVYLALASSNGSVYIYNFNQGSYAHTLGKQDSRALVTAFSPDGKYLATGFDDNSLNLWKIDYTDNGDINLRNSFSIEHPNWVKNLSFSPDSKLLASTALGNKIYLWDILAGQAFNLTPLTAHDVIANVLFLNDGKSLAAGTIGGEVHLWHLWQSEAED